MKLLLLFSLLFFETQNELVEIRKHYALVGLGEEHVNQILSLSKKLNSPESYAYAAGAEMASAQFKLNPINKLSAFNSGKSKLEPLVENNETNIEIRFIRYSIQLKCPAIVGYNKQLKNDRAFILSTMPSIKKTNPELFKYILSFLLLHDNLTDSEKKQLI